MKKGTIAKGEAEMKLGRMILTDRLLTSCAPMLGGTGGAI
jgi:hypothetical protein